MASSHCRPALAALAIGLLTSACTLELELRISCGDGYVDREAGEECDPADPKRSFESACEEIGRPMGEADCDEITCEIDRSFETCAVCGDGFIDTVAGEECEGSDLNGNLCPGDSGRLQCRSCVLDYSECDSCGNGILQPELGEECDPSDSLTLSSSRPCAGDETWPGIVSPYHESKPFASGTYQQCNPNCKWARSTCSYCGDGVLDEIALQLDPFGELVLSQPEECDGDAFSEARLQASGFWPTCAAWENPRAPGQFLEGLRPNVKCALPGATATNIPPCQISGLSQAGAPCCIRAGVACPDAGTPYAEAGLRCCYEYLHADEVEGGEDPCETVFNGAMIGPRVCRPFDP